MANKRYSEDENVGVEKKEAKGASREGTADGRLGGVRNPVRSPEAAYGKPVVDANEGAPDLPTSGKLKKNAEGAV